MRTMTLMRALALNALLVLSGLAIAGQAAAAPVFCGVGNEKICYDDVTSGSSIDYLDINETIQTADDIPVLPTGGLYGAPTAIGNQLALFSGSYDASSTAASGLDQSHSTLNLTVMTKAGVDPLTSIMISEFGDYTFGGFAGTAATGVQGTIGGTITVLDSEAGGAAIGTTFLIDNTDGVLTVTAGPGANFISGGMLDDITSGVGTESWTIDYFLDLTGLGITKAEIQLNNILFANSEASTSASIQKKVSILAVPEPGTLSLLSLGLLGLAVQRRFRV